MTSKVLTTYTDQTLRIGDLATGQNVAELAVDDTLTCVAWHPNGEHLIAGGKKGLYWLRFVQ
ncbi:MAG: hypothetical protein DPW16_17955 [Chloroflexi bacterium]|nr:hypothetical protein [Chloroflexota bacterium]